MVDGVAVRFLLFVLLRDFVDTFLVKLHEADMTRNKADAKNGVQIG
jgi:hypothetical protein